MICGLAMTRGSQTRQRWPRRRLVALVLPFVSATAEQATVTWPGSRSTVPRSRSSEVVVKGPTRGGE